MGKYHWTPEIYKIIEREHSCEDFNNHIILDMLSENDRNKIKFNGKNTISTAIYPLITAKGNLKYIKGHARKVHDDKGNFQYMSGYVQDVTDYFLNYLKLSNINRTVEDVQYAVPISVHYLNQEGKYHWTEGSYRIIDREPREGDENKHIILELMSSEDFNYFMDKVDDLAPGECYIEDDKIYTIRTEAGNVKYLNCAARKIFDEDGNFVRRSELSQDVTARVNYENALIEADKSKTILFQEVHHRVKNNLQLIISFINLEKKFYKDNPEQIIQVTENRISSLALIHEKIYNEDDMSYLEVNSFIDDLDDNLLVFSLHDDIEFKRIIDEDLRLSVDVMTPLSLIINELTTNSFKYAFDDEFVGKKEICKSFQLIEEENGVYCEFKYSDNGKGLPEGYDINTSNSLGWTIIKSLSGQLDGEYMLFNDNGLNFVLKFPLNDSNFIH